MNNLWKFHMFRINNSWGNLDEQLKWKEHNNLRSNVWNDGSCARVQILYKPEKRVAHVTTGLSSEIKSAEIWKTKMGKDWKYS